MLLFLKLKNHPVETLKLLKTLTEIESPYGKEEKIANYICSYLENLGYTPLMDELNVLLNPEREFLITTHIDTVPILAPFSFNGKYAYGTGVADAKASITAILLALEKINKLNFGVVLFYDEENEGKGSENFIKKYKPKKAVVMEPTNLTIATIHYGGLEIKVTTKGRAAHGSTPEKGINAIEKCLEILNQIKKLKNIKISVQKINGGSNEYVIPEKCEMRLEFTFKPEIKAEEVLNQVTKICKDKAQIKVEDIHNGFRNNGNTSKILEEALIKNGIKTSFSEMFSWTDAINLHAVGCDAVVFGPGELYHCHTSQERVKLKDIEAARDVLITLNNLI